MNSGEINSNYIGIYDSDDSSTKKVTINDGNVTGGIYGIRLKMN